MSKITKINGIPIDNTALSSFTYSNNTITILENNGDSYSVNINTMTGLTVNGTLSATTIGSNIGNITAVNSDSIVTNTLTATSITTDSISATTYLGLPTDVRVTGGTYNNSTGIATFTNNTGGTFNVTGFSTSSSFTGGTVTGATIFTGGLTANTISATTYFNLPEDVYVTGGTYNNATGTVTFTNNKGSTFTVTGIYDSYTTGVTISNGTLSLLRNNGLATLTASTLTTRELTFNSNDMALNTATRSTLTPLVMAVTRFDGTGAVDDAGLSFVIPNDYVSGAQFYFTWRAASTSANNAKIYLDLYTGSTNNLGSLTSSVETLGIVTTPTNTNTFIFSSAATSSISFSGGNTVHVRIYRDPSDAADTYTGTLDMINLNFKYTSIS